MQECLGEGRLLEIGLLGFCFCRKGREERDLVEFMGEKLQQVIP
jgi:hypothetical protein